MDKMIGYYEGTYRLHNWVYKRQDKERRNNRDRLQRGEVILEFDYAAKQAQFTPRLYALFGYLTDFQIYCLRAFRPDDGRARQQRSS